VVVTRHPPPVYEGDISITVVARAAQVCRELGPATLSVTCRGVGASTGQHGQGRDERHDVTAALAHFASVLPSGAPLGLAGYSFGAAVAAGVAGERAEAPPLTAVALVAPPVAMTGDEPFAALASLTARLLVVAGDHDEYCPVAALQALGRRLPSAEIKVIEGANHFFFGKL